MASTRTQQQPARETPAAAVISSMSNTNYGSSVHQSQLPERPLHCQTPIPEEDESNSTASEAPEPLTPTNDSNPPALYHQDGTVENGATMQLPEFLKAKPIDFSPAAKQPPSSTRSNENPQQQATPQKTTPINKTQAVSNGDTTPTPRPGIGNRTRSFLRNKLHRTPSNKDATQAPSNVNPGDAERQQALEEFRINVEGTIPTPKKRRGLSWSGRNSTSTRSSNTNSPPSPGSPQMTVNERQLGHQPARLLQPMDNNASLHHSQSSVTLDNFTPKPPPSRLTWGAPAPKKSRPAAPPRRRSASTDFGSRSLSPGPHPKGPTVGMLDTFSKPAAAGAGLKARRLSLSLPDEFTVDHCELDKEFKSSSLMPGKRGKRIGAGATAEVRIMCRKGASDELYAVKEFRGRDKDEKEEEYVKKIKSEYSIAKSLHHPNIVETVRLCTHSSRWNHVMEYCAYGELFTQVEKGLFRTHYKLEDRNCLFKQLLRGVCYLHDHGIAHRDIKLENLLQTSEGFLKISDFGVSEVFSGVHPGLREAGGQCGVKMGEVRLCPPGICGSGPYIAPEVWLKRGDYDPRPLDVWSCAIVYLTMTYGGLPWQASDPKFTHYARFKKGWDEWLERHPDGVIKDEPDGQPKCGPLFANLPTAPIKRLLLKMLHPDPNKRISARDALNTPCINAVECCCPESYDDPKCCIDASRRGCAKNATRNITRKHHHVPPKEEKARFLKHRFDMGDGWA